MITALYAFCAVLGALLLAGVVVVAARDVIVRAVALYRRSRDPGDMAARADTTSAYREAQPADLSDVAARVEGARRWGKRFVSAKVVDLAGGADDVCIVGIAPEWQPDLRGVLPPEKLRVLADELAEMRRIPSSLNVTPEFVASHQPLSTNSAQLLAEFTDETACPFLAPTNTTHPVVITVRSIDARDALPSANWLALKRASDAARGRGCA